MFGPVLDAVFPRRCAGCGNGAWPFCPACHRRVLAIAPPWCVRCGRPAERTLDGCVFCPPPPILMARAPFLFRGPVRSAVHKLKFAGWRTVAEALGRAMAEANAFEAQAVTWVPVSTHRRAHRGYDQAGALAKVVAEYAALPAIPMLRRVRDAGPQARRGGAQRRAAMRGAFEAFGDVPERVLLVDDVLTTGATAGECARVLAAAGASRIGLLTAARAVPGRLPARYTRRGSRPGLWLPGERSPVVDASRGRNDPRKAASVAEHGAV